MLSLWSFHLQSTPQIVTHGAGAGGVIPSSFPLDCHLLSSTSLLSLIIPLCHLLFPLPTSPCHSTSSLSPHCSPGIGAPAIHPLSSCSSAWGGCSIVHCPCCHPLHCVVLSLSCCSLSPLCTSLTPYEQLLIAEESGAMVWPCWCWLWLFMLMLVLVPDYASHLPPPHRMHP